MPPKLPSAPWIPCTPWTPRNPWIPCTPWTPWNPWTPWTPWTPCNPWIPWIPWTPCNPCTPWLPWTPWVPCIPWSPLSPTVTKEHMISSPFVNGESAELASFVIFNIHQPSLLFSFKSDIAKVKNCAWSVLFDILICPLIADVTDSIVSNVFSIECPSIFVSFMYAYDDAF